LIKKLLTALGVLSALLVGAFLLGSLRWHSLRQADPPRLEEVAWGAGPLLAGAAVVPLEPAPPVPVAGFARLHFLRRIARNLMYGVLSDRGRVMAVRLGSLTLLAIPGEPVAEVGRRWRDAAGEGSEVLSLAGDYLGYVETSDRMAKMAGETVHTYYGPELADRLTGTVQIAAEAVRTPRPTVLTAGDGR
jgi:hypothetical protein